VSEDAQEFLSATARVCKKMGQIIVELLLLAGVRKTANVPSEPLDMSQIVADVRHRLVGEIERSATEIVLPDTWPRAIGHAPWVEEVWSNYISNAIKYGGVPPRVELGADRCADGKVHFWVRDNGKGLNEEQLSRIFDEFTRADPTRAKGHGLGLSIVKRIAEKLGGEVRVTSRVGQGSTFGFTLPREEGKVAVDEAGDRPAPARGQRSERADGLRAAEGRDG
jgi:two-component system sensor histidine kinase/response regulator